MIGREYDGRRPGDIENVPSQSGTNARRCATLVVPTLLLLGGCANPTPPSPPPSTPSTSAQTTTPTTGEPFPTGFPATDTNEGGSYCALAVAWWTRANGAIRVHVFAPGPTRITAHTDAADGQQLAAGSAAIPAGGQAAVVDLPVTAGAATVVVKVAGAQNGRCVVQQVATPLTPSP